MTHEKLVALIRQATRDVFTTMLGMELADGEPYVDDSAPGPSEGVIALIGLVGRVGDVFLHGGDGDAAGVAVVDAAL